MSDPPRRPSGAERQSRKALRIWISIRLLLVALCFLVAALGWLKYKSTHNGYEAIRRDGVRAQATVTVVDRDCPSCPPDYDVGFFARGKKRSAPISPNRNENWNVGDPVPIIYDPRDYSNAIYAGPGGDATDSIGFSRPFGVGAVIFGLIGVILLVAGLTRRHFLIGIAGDRKAVGPISVRANSDSNRIYALKVWKGRDLSWRVLSDQISAKGEISARVLGWIAPGSWLVLRTDDGVIWPATRARYEGLSSSPGSFTVVQPELRELKAAHSALLHGYAATLVETDDTASTLASILKGSGLTAFLVKLHIGSKLSELSSVYVRQAALLAPGVAAGDETGTWLASANHGCEELRATISKGNRWTSLTREAGLLAGQGIITTAGIAAIGVLVAAGLSYLFRLIGYQVRVPNHFVGIFILVISIAAAARGYFSAFRNMRKRLFPGASPGDIINAPAIGQTPAASRNCYMLEDQLFSLLGQPKKLEALGDLHAWVACWGTVTIAAVGTIFYYAIRNGLSIWSWTYHFIWMIVLILIWRLFYNWQRESIAIREWR